MFSVRQEIYFVSLSPLAPEPDTPTYWGKPLSYEGQGISPKLGEFPGENENFLYVNWLLVSFSPFNSKQNVMELYIHLFKFKE